MIITAKDKYIIQIVFVILFAFLAGNGISLMLGQIREHNIDIMTIVLTIILHALLIHSAIFARKLYRQYEKEKSLV